MSVLLHGGDRADVDLGAGDDLALGRDQFVITALEHIKRGQLDSRPTGKIVTPLGLTADDQRARADPSRTASIARLMSACWGIPT